MDNEKRAEVSPPPVGGASLLVVFGVLCLTVFALLSLSTVQANQRLSETSAQAVADYYAADCQAQTILACLRTGTDFPADLPEDFHMSAAVSDYPDRPGDTVYNYACALSDVQELQVEVRVGADGAYEVLCWQVVPVGEWEPDEGLDIWDGGLDSFQLWDGTGF